MSRNRSPPGGGQIADDVAGQTREGEEQREVLRRVEDLVVGVALAHHGVPEPVGGGRKLDRHIGHLLETIEFAPVMQDLGDDALLGQPFDPVDAARSIDSAR